MGRAEIPVDLRNPGQVFACLGFLEAADILCGGAMGGFDWSGEERFILEADGTENPVEAVLGFLVTAEVRWLSPADGLKERDGGLTIVRANISSSGEPKPADLPAILVGSYRGKESAVPIGFWADGSSRFSTTFKKSTNGASSHIRFMNAVNAIHNLDWSPCIDNPFNQPAKTESLFRLDPRGSVDPIQAGTSPDKLRKGGIDMRVATYPICEALAVIGLENARPRRVSSKAFRYSVWGGQTPYREDHPLLLFPLLARAAIGGCPSFLEVRHFVVEHVEVKSGGDRKVTTIAEESING